MTRELCAPQPLGLRTPVLHSELSGNAVNLNLAFIGSTGVGKSVSARAVLQAAQSNTWAAGQVGLVLRGEHFSAAGPTGAEALRKQVLQHVIEHLQASQGYGVVVLDEAQKMHPAVLAALVPLMDSKGGGLTMPSEGGGLTQVPLKKLVVILVCDVGHERLRALLGAGAGPVRLRAALRQELHAKWAGQGIAEIMHSIVPFMPLSPRRVQQVAGKYVRQLGRAWRLPLHGQHVHTLQLPGTLQVLPAVTQYMTSMVRFSATRVPGDGNSSAVVFAQFGARQVHEHEDGPLRRLELLLHTRTQQLQGAAEALLRQHSSGQPARVWVQAGMSPGWGEANSPSPVWGTEPASASDWRDFLADCLQQELELSVCVDSRSEALVGASGDVQAAVPTGAHCSRAWIGRLSSSF